ncbi:MAG: LamG domain-containing protein [Burkholderiales bacterium]|nr:LamG domain-containing protein [Burkholderiales bacterium]
MNFVKPGIPCIPLWERLVRLADERFGCATLTCVIAVCTLIFSGGVQAAPTFQAAGNAAGGTGAVTPTWPTHVAGDVALLFVESTGGEAVTLSSNAAGFVQVTGSPQSTGTGTNGTRLTVFWARASSAVMANPTVAAPGNHAYARILTYRGVISSGDPWDVTGGGVKATASNSVTVTGVTTTVPDTLIVQAVAHDRDNASAHFSGQTNANLTGITERTDAGTTAGNGGGFAVWDGEKLTVGATGNTTATITNNVVNAFLTIALRENPPVAFSHWRMNQPAGWNGGANEVTDSGTGGFHGVAASLGTLPTTSSVSPAIPGNPGTCQYGVFNRTNKDYVALPAGYPDLMSTAGGFTVTAWINTTNSALPGQRIFIDDQNNTSPGGWGFSVGETSRAGAGGLRFYYRQPTVVTVDTVAIPSNQWLFVALSVTLVAGTDASSATLYAYDTSGVQVTTYTQAFTWTAGSDAGPPSIGGETNAAGENTSAFGFSGSIDEVRVYQQPLSQGGIEFIRGETSPCVSIDHFSISHSGSGVACDSHTITITAHDLAHNPVSAGGLAVSLSTSNARGTWTGIVAGGGVLSDPTAGDGAATYTFAAGSSSVQLSFRYANLTATSESFNFNVSGGGFSETSGTANAADDPVFTMAQAGFRFRNVTDGNDIIPTQISGKPSNTGFNAKTIRLQAIRTDSATLACAAAFPAAGVRNVEMGAECNNPSTCAGRQVTITNNAATTALPTSNDNGGAGALAYYATGGGVPLLFNANSEADIVITYPDAGQVSLHARYDLDAGVAGYEMSGSSNPFVVRPFGLTFPGIAHSNTATGTLLGAAGDNFSMTVRAYQWASDEDADNDGIPDAGVNISDNGTVPNFAATATISRSANLPGVALGTVSRGPACAGAATIALAGGTATAADWCYSEAGNVILTADVNNYITAGISITGNSGLDGGGSGGYVGRFRPKRFAVSSAALTNRSVAACAPSSSFTYMDEGLALAFTLTAQNTQGVTTQNYNGSYAKHDPTAAASNNTKTAFDIGARNVAPFAALTTRVAGGYVTSAPVWANGVLNVTGGNAALVSVGRPTPDNPPDGPYAQVRFGIAPLDSDGVTTAYDFDADNNAANDRTAVGSITAVRYGRLRMGGASGSQLLALGVPLEAQYWNGTFWITNVDDSCTTLAAGNIGLGNYIGNLNAGETTATIAVSPLQSGRSAIRLSAPGAANNGSVDVALNLGSGGSANACPSLTPAATAGNKAYLRGKWCGPTATRDPAVRARFGIQRSSDEAIYSREATQ